MSRFENTAPKVNLTPPPRDRVKFKTYLQNKYGKNGSRYFNWLIRKFLLRINPTETEFADHPVKNKRLNF